MILNKKIKSLLKELETEIKLLESDNENLKLQNDELLKALRKYTECAKAKDCDKSNLE